MSDLDEATPPARILRVGRKPNPWAWPRWEIAGEDGTFGNRWDDAHSTYRVLYGSSQLEACFVETLARFRPDPHVLAELAQIEGPEAAMAPGLLPRSWLQGRVVGQASVLGRFCKVGSAGSLGHLHRALAATLVRFGIRELDGAAIRQTAPRRFTQEISSYLYSLSDRRGKPRFAGISYLSRFGDRFQNWAIFERPGAPPVIRKPSTRRIDPAQPELRAALRLLGLRLGD
jgi:RES domain-containing protein